jgi:hypothetical protein
MKNVLLVWVSVLPLTLGFNLSSAAASKKSVAQNRAIALQFVDRDCKDFSSQREAQRFFEAAGGPARDPHRLDQDRDGIACEMLS